MSRAEEPAAPRDQTLATENAEPMVPQRPASAKSRSEVRIQSAELVALLAQTLGTEKSREVLGSALKALGIAGETLNQEHALAVLETLAKAQGIVGVVARFAKARVILRFEGG
jgi:hypothetical protein